MQNPISRKFSVKAGSKSEFLSVFIPILNALWSCQWGTKYSGLISTTSIHSKVVEFI